MFNDAELMYQKALKIDMKRKDTLGIATIISNMAIIENKLGNFKYSIDLFKEAISLFKKINRENEISETYLNIAETYQSIKQFNLALEFNLKSYDIAKSNNDLRMQAKCLNNIGFYYVLINQYDKADTYLNNSLEIKEQLNDKQGIAITIRSLAFINKEKGDLQLYKSKLNESLKMFQEIEDSVNIATTLLLIGQSLESDNDNFIAITYYNMALEIAEKINAIPQKIECLEALRTIYNNIYAENTNDYELDNVDKQEKSDTVEPKFSESFDFLIIILFLIIFILSGIIVAMIFKNKKSRNIKT